MHRINIQPVLPNIQAFWLGAVMSAASAIMHAHMRVLGYAAWALRRAKAHRHSFRFRTCGVREATRWLLFGNQKLRRVARFVIVISHLALCRSRFARADLYMEALFSFDEPLFEVLSPSGSS